MAAKGSVSAKDLAMQIGVPATAVREWRRRGWITGRQRMGTKPGHHVFVYQLERVKQEILRHPLASQLVDPELLR
jgi:hypothetical protein